MRSRFSERIRVILRSSVTEANPTTTIAQRIDAVQSAIACAAIASGRKPGAITLLAVSKRQSTPRLHNAYEAGLRDFGENYLQGLGEHQPLLPQDVRWHFIGHLQSKKAKHLRAITMIHSIDSFKVANKLNKLAGEAGRPLTALINVNISMQESKSGVSPEGLGSLLDELSPLAHLRVKGLMCVPSQAEEPRRAFCRLRELRDRVAARVDDTLPELSMGMSGDFVEAIAEGSTIVRIGTGIFGAR